MAKSLLTNVINLYFKNHGLFLLLFESMGTQKFNFCFWEPQKCQTGPLKWPSHQELFNFFKEQFTKRFFVEPKMVVLWHLCEKPLFLRVQCIAGTWHTIVFSSYFFTSIRRVLICDYECTLCSQESIERRHRKALCRFKRFINMDRRLRNKQIRGFALETENS